MTLEQQVNLYQPILGAERRLFSAQAIGVALMLMAVSLLALAGYGTWRTRRIEQSIAALAKQEATTMALAEQAASQGHPTASLAELDAEAKTLSAGIAARRRTLDLIRRSEVTPESGFAARLEALARRQIDGIWLDTILLSSGEGRLAMRGSALDARLVPDYLAALAGENALAGVRFDKLVMNRATAAQAPANVVFDLDGADLVLPRRETSP